MKMIKLILSLMIMYSCSSNDSAVEKDDTFSISGKCVVFLSISEKEYQVLKGDEGIDEILSDYNFYSSQIESELNDKGIKFLRTNSKEIVAQLNDEKAVTLKFDTSKNYVATIFSNGKDQPKLEYGVLTDTDFNQIINDYY